MADLSGQTIGHYSILSKIGEGGMAEVYLAENLAEENAPRVAIKFIKPSIVRNAEAMKRFLDREIEIAIYLDHPHLLEIYESGVVENRPYYTMEYLPGGTLLKKMRGKRKILVDEGLKTLEQVADALIYVHSKGILHRDMKPSNILFVSEEPFADAKLADFGLSKAIGTEAITETGRVMGTAKYLAPEIINGREPLPQSDIFSLGIMSYEMFTGREPFVVDQKIGYLSANVNETPPPPAEINPALPIEVSLLIGKMLERHPLDRYSASSLKRDIRRVRSTLAGGSPTQMLIVRDDPSSAFHTRELKKKNILTEKMFLNPVFAIVLAACLIAELLAGWILYDRIRATHAAEMLKSRHAYFSAFLQDDIIDLAMLIYILESERRPPSLVEYARQLADATFFGGNDAVELFREEWGPYTIRKLRKRLDNLMNSEWTTIFLLAQNESPKLREAAERFISIEPILKRIDVDTYWIQKTRDKLHEAEAQAAKNTE